MCWVRKELAQELMNGSTAFAVIRRSPVPLLLEKAEVVHETGHHRCREACAEMFRRILHPTDFSPTADAAYQVVESLGSTVTREVVLHVQDEWILQHKSQAQQSVISQEDCNRLEERCHRLGKLGSKPAIASGGETPRKSRPKPLTKSRLG